MYMYIYICIYIYANIGGILMGHGLSLQRRSQQFVVYNCMVTRNSVDVLFFPHHLQWVIHRP